MKIDRSAAYIGTVMKALTLFRTFFDQTFADLPNRWIAESLGCCRRRNETGEEAIFH